MRFGNEQGQRFGEFRSTLPRFRQHMHIMGYNGAFYALSSVVVILTSAPVSASIVTALPFSTLSFFAAGSEKPPVEPNPPDPRTVSSSV